MCGCLEKGEPSNRDGLRGGLRAFRRCGGGRTEPNVEMLNELPAARHEVDVEVDDRGDDDYAVAAGFLGGLPFSGFACSLAALDVPARL